MAMIDLYTWSTPNGRKISIALEEMELAYAVHPVNIGNNEQLAPDFARISPNNKIPAIVDPDSGVSVFESGAILMYLGDKTGKFHPSEPKTRIRVHEWLMWQMSAVGPMFGRAHYFLKYNPGKAPFAEQWFFGEAKRLYGVLDRLLASSEFMCGDYSNVKRWYETLADRPAVQRGYKVPDASAEIPLPRLISATLPAG